MSTPASAGEKASTRPVAPRRRSRPAGAAASPEVAAKATRPPLIKLLSHPLVVLAIGAILSGIAIPLVTRGWQDHAQQLQIKTDLVTTISEATTRALVGLAPPAGLSAPTPASQVYADWSTESAVIWSKLAVYFSNDPLVADWATFSQAMDEFYQLSQATTPVARAAALRAVCQYLGAHQVPCSTAAGGPAWSDLAQGMRQVQVGIVDRVLAHGMSL